MDQMKEANEAAEVRELLKELLAMQELMLHRLERIEAALAARTGT